MEIDCKDYLCTKARICNAPTCLETADSGFAKRVLCTDLAVIPQHGEAIASELSSKVHDTQEMQVDECYGRERKYEESG